MFWIFFWIKEFLIHFKSLLENAIFKNRPYFNRLKNFILYSFKWKQDIYFQFLIFSLKIFFKSRFCFIIIWLN